MPEYRLGQPGQNIFRSPKQLVQAKFPKATCKRDWSRGYRIELNADAVGFNGQPIHSIQTNTCNPADAWAEAVFELRLDGFNKPHPVTEAAL